MVRPNEVAELNEPEESIDVENVDLDLPVDYTLQIMVRQRLQHVVNYNIANINYRATKGVGNERESKRLSEIIAGERMAVALIDNLWPTAKNEMRKLTETEKPTPDDIDTELPKEYLDKLMARQRLGHLVNLKVAELTHKASQNVGSEETDRIAKAVATERMAIALIDKDYKKARELMLMLARDGAGLQ